jgi:RNA polymerase sigma-70 factor, ECF subfamily
MSAVSQVDFGPYMSDSSLPLVTRAKQQNREAIETLLVRHLPGLRAWLQLHMGARLRARETPDDLVQSVAREALGELREFDWRGEPAFRHWLYLKAQHKLVDKARYVGAEKRSPDREQALHSQFSGESLVAQLLSPLSEAQSLEEVQRIEQAFAELAEDYQDAISMRRLCKLEYEEIAERMQRSVPAVRNLVHRGLSKLAIRLSRMRAEDVQG